MEHLTSLSVLPRSAQHQSQLKQEDVEPLTDETDTLHVRDVALRVYFRYDDSNISVRVTIKQTFRNHTE